LLTYTSDEQAEYKSPQSSKSAARTLKTFLFMDSTYA